MPTIHPLPSIICAPRSQQKPTELDIPLEKRISILFDVIEAVENIEDDISLEEYSLILLTNLIGCQWCPEKQPHYHLCLHTNEDAKQWSQVFTEQASITYLWLKDAPSYLPTHTVNNKRLEAEKAQPNFHYKSMDIEAIFGTLQLPTPLLPSNFKLINLYDAKQYDFTLTDHLSKAATTLAHYRFKAQSHATVQPPQTPPIFSFKNFIELHSMKKDIIGRQLQKASMSPFDIQLDEVRKVEFTKHGLEETNAIFKEWKTKLNTSSYIAPPPNEQKANWPYICFEHNRKCYAILYKEEIHRWENALQYCVRGALRIHHEKKEYSTQSLEKINNEISILDSKLQLTQQKFEKAKEAIEKLYGSTKQKLLREAETQKLALFKELAITENDLKLLNKAKKKHEEELSTITTNINSFLKIEDTAFSDTLEKETKKYSLAKDNKKDIYEILFRNEWGCLKVIERQKQLLARILRLYIQPVIIQSKSIPNEYTNSKANPLTVSEQDYLDLLEYTTSILTPQTLDKTVFHTTAPKEEEPNEEEICSHILKTSNLNRLPTKD